jgi:NAD(P) transhydrogenase
MTFTNLSLQASTLYANNVSKFLLYMQGTEDHYYIDPKDDIVRGSMVLNSGRLSWPPNPPIAVVVPPFAKTTGKKFDSFVLNHFKKTCLSL